MSADNSFHLPTNIENIDDFALQNMVTLVTPPDGNSEIDVTELKDLAINLYINEVLLPSIGVLGDRTLRKTFTQKYLYWVVEPRQADMIMHYIMHFAEALQPDIPEAGVNTPGMFAPVLLQQLPDRAEVPRVVQAGAFGHASADQLADILRQKYPEFTKQMIVDLPLAAAEFGDYPFQSTDLTVADAGSTLPTDADVVIAENLLHGIRIAPGIDEPQALENVIRNLILMANADGGEVILIESASTVSQQRIDMILDRLQIEFGFRLKKLIAPMVFSSARSYYQWLQDRSSTGGVVGDDRYVTYKLTRINQ